MKRIFLLIAGCLFVTAAFSQRGDSLRIISYNIHHAAPPAKPGAIDIDAVIAALKKYPADVIALQEVDVHTKRSGGINEARRIADGLGMHAFFAKAINHDGGEYGVALLSRFPLSDTQVLLLPMDTTKKGEQRVLGTAAIKLPSGRKVVVGVTHLDHQKNPKSRELQIAAINAFAKKEKKPFIIAGDFNAEPGSIAVQLLDETFQRTCNFCPPTFPAHQPTKTIDFICFKKSKKIKVVAHQVLAESFASDHLPVRAVLQLQ